MAQTKTRTTDVSPASYLAAIEDETRRKDCQALAAPLPRAGPLISR